MAASSASRLVFNSSSILNGLLFGFAPHPFLTFVDVASREVEETWDGGIMSEGGGGTKLFPGGGGTIGSPGGGGGALLSGGGGGGVGGRSIGSMGGSGGATKYSSFVTDAISVNAQWQLCKVCKVCNKCIIHIITLYMAVGVGGGYKRRLVYALRICEGRFSESFYILHTAYYNYNYKYVVRSLTKKLREIGDCTGEASILPWYLTLLNDGQILKVWSYSSVTLNR